MGILYCSGTVCFYRFLAAMSVALVTTGCADLPSDSFFRSDGWLATTYQAPNQGVEFTVSAPQPTSTPFFVEICSNGKWERAAVLGTGLVRVGSMIVSEKIGIASSPNAVKLPSVSQVTIPVDQMVKFRIRSHRELQGTWIKSCTVPVAMKPEKGSAYKATWHMRPESCEVNLISTTNVNNQKLEQAVPKIEADDTCGS